MWSRCSLSDAVIVLLNFLFSLGVFYFNRPNLFEWFNYRQLLCSCITNSNECRCRDVQRNILKSLSTIKLTMQLTRPVTHIHHKFYYLDIQEYLFTFKKAVLVHTTNLCLAVLIVNVLVFICMIWFYNVIVTQFQFCDTMYRLYCYVT